MEKVIKKHIVDYAKLHGRDMTEVTFNGKKINLNQYIAYRETNAFMKKLGDDYKRAKRRNQFQGHPEKSVKEELGYGAEQLKVGSDIYEMLGNFYAVRRILGEEGAIRYLNKKGINDIARPNPSFNAVRLMLGDKNSKIVKERKCVSSSEPGGFGMTSNNMILRRIILGYILKDKKEIESIRDDILKEAEKEGIDPKTFCFDKYVLKKA